MSWKIAGRTVLITGAARGIGAETALRLHDLGANIALVGLEPARLTALAELLGDRAAAFEADVTNPEAMDAAAAATVARFGGIDVAIANAGLYGVGTVVGVPLDEQQRILDVNLGGVLHTIRATAPHVVERNGYLLSVASMAAVSHAPLMGAYAASKAGVEALTNCLRQELRPTGTRVGTAYFGIIDTDLGRAGKEHPTSQTMERMMPAFALRMLPVSDAVDAIQRAVLGRRSRVWAPSYVGGSLLARGLIQPLLEQRVMRDKRLTAALDQAAAEDPGDTLADPSPAESSVLAAAAQRVAGGDD